MVSPPTQTACHEDRNNSPRNISRSASISLSSSAASTSSQRGFLPGAAVPGIRRRQNQGFMLALGAAAHDLAPDVSVKLHWLCALRKWINLPFSTVAINTRTSLTAASSVSIFRASTHSFLQRTLSITQNQLSSSSACSRENGRVHRISLSLTSALTIINLER